MFRNRKFILLVLLAGFVFLLNAQNTNSPYSRYGYGVLNDQAIGPAKAMGGISYGVRGQNVNPGNPASYSGIDSLTFIFDIGISYSNTKLSDGLNTQSEHNGGLDYLAMLFPLGKKLGMSVGFLPFSSVGYSFGSVLEEGNVAYQKTYSGSGGFSQVYGGLAYAPIKNLSLGGNVSFLYGSVQHDRSLPQMSQSYVYASTSYTKLTINAAKFDFGAQYELPISKDKRVVLGLVFSPAINPNSRIDQEYVVFDNSTTSPTLISDTLTSTRGNVGLPNSFGFGFTFLNKPNFTFGADVTYQQWSKVKYSENMNDDLMPSERFNDTWRINTGVEYVVNPYDRNFLKKIRFRGGLNYGNSYLNVKNIDNKIGGYKEYGATLGFGLPIRDTYSGRVSYININFSYNDLRPNLSNMIKEQYFGVSLNVNINDMWFLKSKLR